MDDHAVFTWVPFLAFGWVALAVAVLIAFQEKRGKPLFPRAPVDAISSERTCSGRSLNTFWRRIGGARNCLLVALKPERLVITPTFPFNLIFLPEMYRLDHNLAYSAIREAADRKGIPGRHIPKTYFDKKVHRVELRLRQREAFLERLRQLGIPVTVS